MRHTRRNTKCDWSPSSSNMWHSVLDDTADRIVTQESLRLMSLSPEDAPHDWESRIQAIVQAHRELMTPHEFVNWSLKVLT